jgi:hypothetical protein
VWPQTSTFIFWGCPTQISVRQPAMLTEILVVFFSAHSPTYRYCGQIFHWRSFEIPINSPYMKSINFWDITPCRPLSVNRHFWGTYRIHLQGRINNFSKKPACHLLACWFLAEIISSTLKMEAICSSETSVDTQRTTKRYIPEVDTLNNHRCENLKSYNSLYMIKFSRHWFL